MLQYYMELNLTVKNTFVHSTLDINKSQQDFRPLNLMQANLVL